MKAITSSNKGVPPPLFFARAIDRISPQNKIDALKEISSWHDDFPTPDLILLDENGRVIYPEGKQEILNWNDIAKPHLPYEFVYVSSERTEKNPSPPFGPPRPLMPDALVKLQGTPEQYLFIRAPVMRPPNNSGGFAFFPIIVLGSLLLSLLLGVGTTIAIIYIGVKKGIVQADNVISELHNGNLKARFTITRKDEFGKAMMRFNTMAEEIEKLVLNLKAVDQARTRLLQELAHDLRTPIASLKNLLEALNLKRQNFTLELQNEMTELALKEIFYFERLVEDLLFLAQIKEPALQAQHPLVSISDVLSDTADDVFLRYQQQDKKIELKQSIEKRPLEIHGDHHLITRLFRNALENSFSFASSTVSLSTKINNEESVEILIEDDGPGFSNEALATFGTRKITRKLESKSGGRLSVGLGSVVMKTIVETFGGEIKVSNRLLDNKILGARVEIILPWNQ
jgi:signal transduction histidine kinase